MLNFEAAGRTGRVARRGRNPPNRVMLGERSKQHPERKERHERRANRLNLELANQYRLGRIWLTCDDQGLSAHTGRIEVAPSWCFRITKGKSGEPSRAAANARGALEVAPAWHPPRNVGGPNAKGVRLLNQPGVVIAPHTPRGGMECQGCPLAQPTWCRSRTPHDTWGDGMPRASDCSTNLVP
jgi:hypothetical protein